MIYIIVTLSFVLLIALLILQYLSSAPNWIKASGIFLIVALYISIYEHYTQFVATPIQGYPEEKFIYMHHVHDAQNNTTVWAYHHNSNRHRLYQFPYNRENAKKLQKAKQGRDQQGAQSEITVEKKGNEQTPGFEIDEWRGEENLIEK